MEVTKGYSDPVLSLVLPPCNFQFLDFQGSNLGDPMVQAMPESSPMSPTLVVWIIFQTS